MKDDQPHHLTKEAAEPTVIHHAEETILERWLKRGMERGASFWLTTLGAFLAVILAVWALNNWLSRPSPTAQAWTGVMVPATVTVPAGSDKYEGMPEPVRPYLAVADESPGTPASRWSLLQAAAFLYAEAMREIPNQKDTGRPKLGQAVELYDRVLASAPKDSPEALQATLGKARAQEARGDLDDAKATYLQVAEGFPGAPEAVAAKERAKRLDDAAVRSFYKELYEKDFATAAAPTGGINPGAGGSLLDIPGFGTGSATGIDGLPPGFGTPAPGGVPAGGVSDPLGSVPPVEAAPTGESPAPAPAPETSTPPSTTPETPGAPAADTPPAATTPAPAPTDNPAPAPAGGADASKS